MLQFTSFLYHSSWNKQINELNRKKRKKKNQPIKQVTQQAETVQNSVICCLSVVLYLDKGDFPENVPTVCPR